MSAPTSGPTSEGPAILFLSGASGAGKTALVSAARNRSRTSEVRFLHFDSIGVPPHDAMPDRWQEKTTHQWIQRIVADENDAALVVIEGSSDLRFVEEAFARSQVSAGYIILVHCEEEERMRRLTEDREQPDLVTPRMNSWARYLHEQARKMGATVLDTSDQTMDQSVAALEREIARLSDAASTQRTSPRT